MAVARDYSEFDKHAHHWSAFEPHNCLKCGAIRTDGNAPCPGVQTSGAQAPAQDSPVWKMCLACGCGVFGGHYVGCRNSPFTKPSDPLADLTAHVEFGLTRWPDGETAICVFNHEPYETFALGYRVGHGNTTDANLIAHMLRYIDDLKIERKANFISWRKRLEFAEQSEVETAQDMRFDEGSTRPKLINETIRMLRCRVLITAHANDKEWRDSDPNAYRPYRPSAA